MNKNNIKRKVKKKAKKALVNKKKSNNRLMGAIATIAVAAIAIFFYRDDIGNFLNNDRVYREYLEDGYTLVHFIDIGQGDAVLIQTLNGSVLIDGGDNHTASLLEDYLRRVGISEVTYMIATHPHADHIGGLANVMDNFLVHRIIAPDVTHTTLTFERFVDAIERNDIYLQRAVVGDTFNVDNVDFLIIHPNNSGYSNLNDYSVSVRVEIGDVSFIFTGDAETIAEQEMVNLQYEHLNADILHVGHHGSSTSTIPSFLEAVNPEIAIINVGRNNRYNHPHSSVMNRLEDINARIYRTDMQGHIVLATNGNNVHITTQYEMHPDFN